MGKERLQGAIHERESAPGTKLPLRGEKTLTARTGSLQHAPTRRADLEIVDEVRLARRAGTTFRQVGQQGLFLDLLLIRLRERPARTNEQINKETAEKAERYQEHDQELELAIGGTRVTITPHPDDQGDPETQRKH